MKRAVTALLIPPVAACRYGCASCCAAPIGAFWVTGLVGLIYGYHGGPAGFAGVSWGTVGLGAVLWAVASVWTAITLLTVDEERCKKETPPSGGKTASHPDESDPLEELDGAG